MIIRFTPDEVCDPGSGLRGPNLGDELLTMVTEPEGARRRPDDFTFDEANGGNWRPSCSASYEPVGQWSELEKSALTETGNILGRL